MQADVLIHLDALGHMPHAALLGVGCAAFNIDEESDVTLVYRSIRLQSNGLMRLVDQSTWDWWVEDNPYLPSLVDDAIGLQAALLEVIQFFDTVPDLERVWFWDVTAAGILHHALETNGMERPWKYFQARDARTFLNVDIYAAPFASPVGQTPEQQMKRRVAALQDAQRNYQAVFYPDQQEVSA